MTVIDDSTSLALGLIGLIAFVAIYVWVALALAAVFRKSGEEGWKAWVPILNTIVLLRLGGLSGWLLLLALVPVLGALALWVAVIIACHRIGAAFGFGPGMTVLAALLLPVWATVIGFGASRWVGAETRGGPRRTPGDSPVDETGLPALPEYGRAPATYAPIAPPPAYGRAPAAGWVPPPVPPAAAAASALPPIPPMPGVPGARPPLVTPDANAWEGLGLRASEEFTGEVTGAVTGAPAPISAVPFAPRETREDEPAGPRRGADGDPGVEAESEATPPVTRVPVAAPAHSEEEPWAPSRSPMSDPEAFPETSGPVSAIAGAPAAGGPRSALTSVSAQHTGPELPDEAIDETIIARRRQSQWSLVLPTGTPVALGADVVILGRRPAADAAFPGAQLIAIEDGTVSKTHARLVLRDDSWWVTDLGSTNGVLFATVLGTEVEAVPGVESEAGERFLLGDAEVRLVRSDA